MAFFLVLGGGFPSRLGGGIQDGGFLASQLIDSAILGGGFLLVVGGGY